MTFLRLVGYSLLSVVLVFRVAAAQDTGSRITTTDSLRTEIRSIRSSLDSLHQLVLENQDFNEGDITDLEKLLDKRLQEVEAKVDASNRATAFIVFNPRTTAFMNIAGRIDNHLVQASSGIADIDNRLFLRTVELDFRAPVDPYAEAVTILSMEDEAGTGYAIDVEEAYGIIKRLPLLEAAPLGLKWKIGKFRIPFGQSNLLHMHDLPWTTRPLPVVLYLGTEHGPFFESGTNPVGMDFSFFVPSPFSGLTIEANADIVRGGALAISEGHPSGKVAGVGHLSFSADLENEHLMVFGLSGYAERGQSPTSVYGVDVLYKWAPAEQRTSRSFVVGGELMMAEHQYTDPALGNTTVTPTGWYAYLQYQASYRWYIGARFDWAEDPALTHLRTQSAALYASYYTTEFLRFRIGVERSQSDIPALDGLLTGLFEVNLVYGSHPIEPYWVNR